MSDTATGLELIYDLIYANSTVGQTFMGNTPDVAGLVREVVEDDDPPVLTMGPGIAIEKQMIHIGVRGDPEDYIQARNEAIRLRKLIVGTADFTSRGLELIQALPVGGVKPMGRDENKREQFTISFRLWIGEVDE